MPVAVSGSSTVLAHLERHLTQCRRERACLALLCIGVEHIDIAGDPACAALEQRVRDEVALRLRRGLRATDIVLRESERDAVVLLPGVVAETAQRVARRLHRVLGGVYTVDGVRVQVRVRVGFAAHPGDGARAAELLCAAMAGAIA